ncbi:zinc ribbon domain-containing protein [Ruminococcus albus]|uniref:Zinc-ribbon domain-containing protein n=1 Tax=Ruminococcus albus (strain ATCC 27210 / DSM 20455 / JCM 14654 / NCDO 2250 / 7) TaxID=697329 RepID=E6UF63_RUMA7|nr:zinc ribbon domain-containing protein [Ruminococcus albus]ADU23590.1 hypothetical protein Rumal_3125 [Ruminococcus albus 7 = DSM 20455]
MKFCAKCGAQMEDGMKFCGSCGAVVSDDAATQQPQYGQTQPYNNYAQGVAAAPKQPNQTVQKIVAKVKKNPLIAIIPLAALVAVIVLIIVLVNVTKYQKIDAKELFRFEFEGLNSHGTVTGELNAYPADVYDDYDKILAMSKDMKNLTNVVDAEDAEYLARLLGTDKKVSPYLSLDPAELKKVWTKAKDPAEMVSMRKALLQTNSKKNFTIKAKFNKEKDLKNGDKIKVTVDYDEKALKDAKIKLTNTEFEIEVKNLEDGIEFDPFDSKYLTVSFEGVDGSGSMNMSTTSDTPEEIRYQSDNKYDRNLKNGDKVTITCSTYDELKPAGDAFYFESDNKFYIIKSKDALTKEIEVTGLTELKEIDVFENIKFKFERGTPFLDVSRVDNDDMDKVIVDNVSFSVLDGENLKVGDKFKVKAYPYSSLSEEGYKIKGEPDSEGYFIKEFTVDDTMPAYVTSANGRAAYESADFKDMIADEESELKEHLQGKSSSWLFYDTNVEYDGDIEKIESLTLKDVYVSFTDKNNSRNISDYVNRIYGVYDVKVKTDGEEKQSASFIAVVFADNIICDNGKFIKQSSYSSFSFHFYGSMADFNKEISGKEGYTLTKCGSSGEVKDKPDDSKPEETTTTTTAKPEKDNKDDSKVEKTDDSKAEEKDDSKDKEKETKKETEKATEKAEDKPADEEKAS